MTKHRLSSCAAGAFILFSSWSCLGAEPAQCEEQDKNGSCALYAASVIQLIARPGTFHGKKVRVIGYMNIEFEGSALYLHAEDYKHSLSKNGLWLEVPRDWLAKATCKNKSYVLLEATVNAENTGHFGMWSAGLENVTRCTTWR